MRDINQKASDINKQIAIVHSAAPKPIALRRSVWLSYLLSLGAISTGGLSILAVAALLGTKPAQANMTEQSASPPTQIVEEEQASPTYSLSSEQKALVGVQQALSLGEPDETTKGNVQPIPDLSSNKPASDSSNLKASDAEAIAKRCCVSEARRASVSAQIAKRVKSPSQSETAPTPDTSTQNTDYNFAPFAIETENFSSLQQQSPNGEAVKDATASRFAVAVPTANSLSFTSADKTTPNRDSQARETEFEKSTTVLPAFDPFLLEEVPILDAEEYEGSQLLIEGMQPTTSFPTVAPDVITEGTAPSAIAQDSGVLAAQQSEHLRASVQIISASTPNSVEPNVSQPVAEGTQPEIVAQATATGATTTTSDPYSGPGAAELLGDNIQAQSSIDAAQEAQSENAARTNNPLAPSLVFQGGFITQGETGARARLTGLYPVSPNLLFGGTLDLTTGEGFSDTPGTGLDLTELYVPTSLPSYPNLRLTAGLLDLTSYFDRNSFAKDSLTHFFNPVFQTNPALARTGIGSRPAALLNWDITDNLQARAAAFSSSRNLGELAVDGFAGEVALRVGNAIIRGTYATDRDDQRNGFEEIYGIARSNGELGPRTSDRESSYGINAEYYIPEIKMGLFGRYGHYRNTSMDEGGDTYSLGLNFLDLFMRDDRLGFGYGRDLSSNSLRRASGNKVPDVWELFYDFRLTSYLRAGVTLQARDEFSDIVAGFRVKTEFDLLNLGRAFR